MVGGSPSEVDGVADVVEDAHDGAVAEAAGGDEAADDSLRTACAGGAVLLAHYELHSPVSHAHSACDRPTGAIGFDGAEDSRGGCDGRPSRFKPPTLAKITIR